MEEDIHTLGDHSAILLDKIPEFVLDLFRRIKDITIDWELFRELTEDEPAWLLLIKSDQMIITIREINPGTTRESLSEVALRWKDYCLRYLHIMQNNPNYEYPKLKVMDLSPPGTEENSKDDKYHVEPMDGQDSICICFSSVRGNLTFICRRAMRRGYVIPYPEHPDYPELVQYSGFELRRRIELALL
ncbi:hypothetical protein BDZ45DRAFT_738367 [Acephala macrosclerotiorum]|nr:hypothetical protein BDZ45DRAFT_738367 [Acephala macrosclerotiorum]